LDALCAELWPPEKPAPPAPGAVADFPDAELLERARRARNGADFTRLWAGESLHGGDSSADDLDLVDRLVFWTNGDPARVDRLFRASGLMRPKWDEKHAADGRTYGQMTVDRALADWNGEGYAGRPAAPAAAAARTPAEPATEAGEALPYGGETFHVIRRQHVTLSRPVFVIPGRVVRGTLAVIGGQQGQGKGKMIRDLMARATRGGPWPFQSGVRFPPMTVLDFNAEDNPEQTIFPEYEAAAADFERLHVVHRREDGRFPNLRDPRQLEQLEAMIRELQATFVTVDPVGYYFPGSKFNATEEVLEALAPLMAIAERTESCILPVLHFNKGTANDALAKFLGSAMWTAVARSAMGVVADPDCNDEERERRQLWTVKSNLAPKRERKPWGFELTADRNGVVRVVWDDGPANSNEAAAFRLEGARRGRGSDTQQEQARLWLLKVFAPGQTYPAKELYDDAIAAGHEGWAVKRALQGSSEFAFLTVSRGYQKGTRTEWFLAGTGPEGGNEHELPTH